MNSEKVIGLLEQLLVELKKQPEPVKVKAEELDYGEIENQICYESIADHIDLDDLASRVVVDESEVAQNLDVSDIASYVSGSDIVEYFDYGELDYKALAVQLIKAIGEGDIS